MICYDILILRRVGRTMTPADSSILLVDDEELNREGLARRLERHGYAVTGAKNGREAIERLGERHFDLVLLDIMMPGMGGLEVLKFLRRVDSLLELPIIMVTARGESEDVVEALELGANDYVTKPLDFPVVLARIRTQLTLRRAVAQATELEQKLNARNQELEAAARERAESADCLKGHLEAAARVQQAFLPALPPEVPGGRLAWVFEPCGQLAGALPNVLPLGDRHLGLCHLDVNGRGVAAALLAVTASQLLARVASPPPFPVRRPPRAPEPTPVPPAQVVGRLSEQFSREAASEHPCTLLYGVLGLEEGDFRFVSAGHPGPIHLPRGGSPALLGGNGLPVGVGRGDYRERAARLRPGDRLVLHSGGVTEARGADGEHFGTARLLDRLGQTRCMPLPESLDALLEDLERWRGDSTRRDDISILAFEFTGRATTEAGGTAGRA
jgi:sigma-B regulation protein RsbU (phosphoserine phosphatase)